MNSPVTLTHNGKGDPTLTLTHEMVIVCSFWACVFPSAGINVNTLIEHSIVVLKSVLSFHKTILGA